MPRIKYDYIVSFSSEDPDHPASNLLSNEVSKKKWLCAKNNSESSCSVVIQLSQSAKISSVTVGACGTALVEILVGRSEAPQQPYQVLVPVAVFVSARESRSGTLTERVRSFSQEQLAEDTRELKWDRLKVVCSQPYSKHCQYGLSFVHAFEPDAETSSSGGLSAWLLDTRSDDEDCFKPGELFAKHLRTTAAATAANTTNNAASVTNSATSTASTSSYSSTDAAIRQASSQAMKNISESSTKIVKTPIHKESNKRKRSESNDHNSSTSKAETPRQKRAIEKAEPRSETKNKTEVKVDPSPARKRSSEREPPTRTDKEKDPKNVLRGVVCTMSGYVNPERGELRHLAERMGARVLHDLSPDVTHLICAFENTPKLRAASDKVIAVRGDWIRECSKRATLVPWRWYATRKKDRRSPPPETKQETRVEKKRRSTTPESSRLKQNETHSDSTECDTDDEIEKVIKDNERLQQVAAKQSSSDDDGNNTEEETTAERKQNIKLKPDRLLAAPLAGRAVAFGKVPDRALLERYVRAYGGVIAEPDEDGVLLVCENTRGALRPSQLCPLVDPSKSS